MINESNAQDDQSGNGQPQAIYTRPMPGGGYIRAELLVSQPSDLAGEHLRGRVVMERRSFAPPSPDDDELVVEEVEGSDRDALVAELVRIASDNAAIARRVLRHGTAPRQRAD